MKRSLAVLMATPLVLACWVAAPQPAHAQITPNLDIAKIAQAQIHSLLAILLNPMLANTQNGDTETLTGIMAAGGVDVAVGTATATGNGGTETVTIPLTNLAGSVTDGEQVIVTVDDLETGGGLHVADADLTVTLTCHLDSQGNGICS